MGKHVYVGERCGKCLSHRQSAGSGDQNHSGNTPASLSVCKVKDYSGVDLTKPFCFTGTTDEENSLVCPEALVPGNTIERDDGWKGFRIIGQLDFLLNRNSGAHIKDPGRGWDWHICHLDLFHLSVRSCRSSRIVQRSRADQNV